MQANRTTASGSRLRESRLGTFQGTPVRPGEKRAAAVRSLMAAAKLSQSRGGHWAPAAAPAEFFLPLPASGAGADAPGEPGAGSGLSCVSDCTLVGSLVSPHPVTMITARTPAEPASHAFHPSRISFSR